MRSAVAVGRVVSYRSKLNTASSAAPDLKPLVSVIAPLYNEAATLPEFIARLTAATRALLSRYRFEFIVVDDGSRDNTLEVAKSLLQIEPRLRIIELRRNFGQTAALQAGLASANGAIIVSMDSDLQHFPEDIPKFIEGIEQGADLVCGWRHDRREGILRRWPSRLANVMIKQAIGVPIHDFGTTFRAYRADLAQHIRLLGEQHRFVPALASLIGSRIVEVKISNIERPSGTSNYGLGRTFGVIMDILFLYFSRYYFTRPLKGFGKIALILLLIGGGISGYLIIYASVTGVPTIREHGGWFLLSAILLMASLQILLVGLLAEILVRIYYRIGHSDGYVIRREWSNREEIDT